MHNVVAALQVPLPHCTAEHAPPVAAETLKVVLIPKYWCETVYRTKKAYCDWPLTGKFVGSVTAYEVVPAYP